MRNLIVAGFVAVCLMASAHAQTAEAVTPPAAAAPAAPANPATPAGKAASVVSAAANQVSKEVAEVSATFDRVYADAAKNPSPAAQLMATAAGAGLGFLASSYILTTTIAPLASTALGNVGFSDAVAGIVTSSTTTLGLVWGTYAGGVYAHDLVTTK